MDLNLSEKSKDFNERLIKLEDKLNRFEYGLTYYKLKSNETPIVISGSADHTIRLWDIDKVSVFFLIFFSFLVR